MKLSEARRLVREVLKEANATSGGATFTAGEGENYSTPKAFRKRKKFKTGGLVPVSRPKRPSHTKLIDYLQ